MVQNLYTPPPRHAILGHIHVVKLLCKFAYCKLLSLLGVIFRQILMSHVVDLKQFECHLRFLHARMNQHSHLCAMCTSNHTPQSLGSQLPMKHNVVYKKIIMLHIFIVQFRHESYQSPQQLGPIVAIWLDL
jgi:hypothetical protein